MMYLDTHVVVWLHVGLFNKFSSKAIQLLEEHELLISPIVTLELQYLYEIHRISYPADNIIDNLTEKLGLGTCDTQFLQLVKLANQFNWTRDPFDRLIVAAAKAKEALLLTKDATIIKHYSHAMWD